MAEAFPLYFTIFSFIFGMVVIWQLLYSGRAFGFLLEKVIKFLFLKQGESISVGSLAIAFLGGQLFVRCC